MNARIRSIAAALAGLAGAGYFFFTLPNTAKAAAYIPPVSLVLAAVAAQLPKLGAQLLARGIWWSNLVLGVLLTVLGSSNESFMGLGLTVACGAALVLSDHRALTAAADSAGFRPAAYAGTLQLLLVLALADAQTLILFAAIEASDHGTSAKLFALVAVGFLVGFVGLLRLALWGVGLTMASAFALAAALLWGGVRIDHDLQKPLLVIAAMQLLVPLPMLASMALKRKLPEAPTRLRAHLARGFVVAVVALTVLARVFSWRSRG